MAEMYQSANREQRNGEQRIFGAVLSDTPVRSLSWFCLFFHYATDAFRQCKESSSKK